MQLLETTATALRRAGVCTLGLVPDALMIAGAGAIAYGAWLLHPAAGFVVGGGFGLAAGWLAARKGAA